MPRRPLYRMPLFSRSTANGRFPTLCGTKAPQGPSFAVRKFLVPYQGKLPGFAPQATNHTTFPFFPFLPREYFAAASDTLVSSDHTDEDFSQAELVWAPAAQSASSSSSCSTASSSSEENATLSSSGGASSYSELSSSSSSSSSGPSSTRQSVDPTADGSEYTGEHVYTTSGESLSAWSFQETDDGSWHTPSEIEILEHHVAYEQAIGLKERMLEYEEIECKNGQWIERIERWVQDSSTALSQSDSVLSGSACQQPDLDAVRYRCTPQVLVVHY